MQTVAIMLILPALVAAVIVLGAYYLRQRTWANVTVDGVLLIFWWLVVWAMTMVGFAIYTAGS